MDYNKLFIIMTVSSILLFGGNLFSQTYKEDSLAVRAILDSNNLYNVSVEEVTVKEEEKIVELNLQFRDLIILPQEIGNLTSLKVLRLNYNKITTFPSTIGKLISLTNLETEYNKLIELPPEIGDLENLSYATFNDNNLKTLPSEFGNLKSLKCFPFWHNNLQTIPNTILELEPEPVFFCYNDSLTFTEEQKEYFSITDYQDFYNKYCAVEIYNKSIKNILLTSLLSFNITDHTISFILPFNSKVLIKIYNIKGKFLDKLLDEKKDVGNYSIKLDKNRYSSGIYYVIFYVDKNVIIRKIVLFK